MQCLVCKTNKTIRAHLIPACFAKEIRAENDSDIIVTEGKTDNYRPSKTGKFDLEILCERCDGIIGNHENYAFGLLTRMNLMSSGIMPGKHIEVDNFDKEKFYRFCAGVSWKYASTRSDLGRIEIGPYRDRLREIAFENAPLPYWIDGSLFRLGTPTSGATFFREPHPDKQLGVKIIRFSLSHFVIFLKIDQRRPEKAPGVHWLSFQGPVVVPIVPFDAFEEGAIALRNKVPGTRTHNFLYRKKRGH